MEQEFVITHIDSVIFVDKDRHTEARTVFRKHLKSHELIFHFSGQRTVYFDGKVLENPAGSIRFLPKGDVSEYIVERAVPGDCIDVFFQTDVPIAPEAFALPLEENSRVRGLFQKLFTLWVRKGSGYYFECISLLYQIFAELQKRSYLPEKQYRTVKPAISYIENHFLDVNISMDDLAVLCGISYSYLKKIFITKFGVPPKKYILQLKINYACDLLKTELYTVTQVAEICGFSSIHYFSRLFKEHLGISPTEFAARDMPVK